MTDSVTPPNYISDGIYREFFCMVIAKNWLQLDISSERVVGDRIKMYRCMMGYCRPTLDADVL